MLIKEYRIALPMSLSEYQVAQLYMIQKKSREESCGEDSGVEILENRPYSDGPGGSGQFTHKVYHVGSHIPSWFRALLPKAALQVEEQSWNAYPYTRTRYTCPFVEKFSIDIETYYRPDCGEQHNIFNLVSAEKRQRLVDVIDIVKDPIPQAEYKQEEDPRLYRSVKTGRGPLSDSWIEERQTGEKPVIMCAYKLCKVEFRYWGMQAKIEQFIHDVGLRRVMLRAHRQAWCWQDEWCDLSMEDVRALEEETARTLARRMGKHSEEPAANLAPAKPMQAEGPRPHADLVDGQGLGDGVPKQWSMSSRSSHCSQLAGAVTAQSLSEWRMQNIAQDSDNSSDEEFFDAHEDLSDNDEVFSKVITRWSSDDFIDKAGAAGDPDDRPGDLPPPARDSSERPPPCSMDTHSLSESVSMENIGAECKIHVLMLVVHGGNFLDAGPADGSSKQADLSTLASVFDMVTRVHFPEALGHVVSQLVPCPPLCAEAWALISKLSPYGYDEDGLSLRQDQIPLAALPLLATSSAQYREAVTEVITKANQTYAQFLKSERGNNFRGQVCIIGDCVGGILAFDALCNYPTAGSTTSSRRGSVSTERLSPEILIDTDPLSSPGLGMSRPLSKSHGELSTVTSGDPEGALPRKHSNSSASDIDSIKQHQTFLTTLQASALKDHSSLRPSSSMLNLEGSEQLEFEVSDLFLFGSPLALVLALRKTAAPGLDFTKCRPTCQQIYNLFHPADPSSFRLEPLLATEFQIIPPFTIPRYQKFPLGDGNSSFLADTLQSFPSLFSGVPEPSSTTALTPAQCDPWKNSEQIPGSERSATPSENLAPCEVAKVVEKWWGCKRIDYALYCPDALTAFPTVTLPHLFHASYWESTDVVAFILRQVMKQQNVELVNTDLEISDYSPPLPQGKWLRKRTQVKIRNVAANHRASDLVVAAGAQQVLSGRFAYGPLDVVTLTGEKVDIYILTQPPSGKWIQFGSEITSNSGRVSCTIPSDQRLPIGVYPVRMFVRGDHTFAECFLTVLPKGTECVVFSIDGSFAASVSIMGSDPKVRAGAVDVVRHWQDRGYLIVYVTGRPDMQKQKVVAWLSQHNFPHGVVSFCDGLVHDPLRQKTAFLQSLLQEVQVKIEAAYGSTKDISVYTLLRVPAQQIYIVGRPSKKLAGQCQFLSEGYTTHLVQLESRRAKGGFGGAGRGHVLRAPTCPRPSGTPGRCSSERGLSSGIGQRPGKPRSTSLRFDSEP